MSGAAFGPHPEADQKPGEASAATWPMGGALRVANKTPSKYSGPVLGLGVCLKHRPGCQGRSCNTLPAKVGRVRGLPNLPAEVGKSTLGATNQPTYNLVPAVVSSYGG